MQLNVKACPLPSYLLKINKIWPHKDLYTNVHSTIILSSLKLELKQPTRKWVNKLCCTHRMEYYSAIKTIDTYNTDESQKHYAKWKKSNTQKKATDCMVPLIWNPRKAKAQQQKTHLWLPKAGRMEGTDCKGHKGTFLGNVSWLLSTIQSAKIIKLNTWNECIILQ